MIEAPFTFAFDIARFVNILFYILLFFFSVYGLFLGYHWFTFGTSRATSSSALALYLIGGAVLFIILGVSINLI